MQFVYDQFAPWYNPAIVKMCIGYWLLFLQEPKHERDVKRHEHLAALDIERYVAREKWFIERKHYATERILDRHAFLLIAGRLYLMWHDLSKTKRVEVKEAKIKESFQNDVEFEKGVAFAA